MLIFTIMDLLSPVNTSFNTHKVIMLSHSKAQFLLKVKCAKSDSVFYCIVLNIERFDTALEHFQLKIRKNDIEVLSL